MWVTEINYHGWLRKMTEQEVKEQELKKIKWAAKMQAKYSSYSEPNEGG